MYEGVRKDKNSFYMPVNQTNQSVPVCGDIKIEFFNKSKISKKVHLNVYKKIVIR